MLRALYDYRRHLELDLAEQVGPDIAELLAQVFVATVVARKRELEAAREVARNVYVPNPYCPGSFILRSVLEERTANAA